MAWKNVPKDITQYEGFVYIIRHLKTKKFYIGKKIFWNKLRRKPLKGYKRVRLCRVESKWKDYWGSSKEFEKYIKQEGKDNFERIMVHHCKTKSEMSYKELLEQIKHDVLNDNKSFNGIINVRLRRTS